MGSFANTIFTALMGWMQSVASGIWSLATDENKGGLLRWIGDHWLVVALVLCALGLLIDLAVYMARWRPDLVWKSFWNRRKHRQEDAEEEKAKTDEAPPAPATPAFRREERVPEVRKPERKAAPTAVQRAEDEMARWKKEPEAAPEEPKPARSGLVTAAGYVVPDDSPYRRPTARQEEQEPEPPEPAARDSREAETPSVRRRRRLNVNDLFSSPEEEIYEFEAPQNLIDRKKAYREPVYPRGWNRGKDSEE